MQITHVIPGDLWAGAESQVFYLLRQLAEDPGYKVSVIIFNEGELYNRLNALGVKLHLIDENTNSSFAMVNGITKILKNDKPDILHAHEYKSHVLSGIAKLFARSSTAIVRTLHGKTAIPFNIKMLKSYIVFQTEHYILKYYTKGIIAVSADIQQELETRYSMDRIFHIPNAVSITANVKLNQEAVRKTYNVDKQQFWVGAAARLVDVKNLDMLIDVALILSKKAGDNYRVSIFGDGPLKEHLQARIVNEKLEAVVCLHGHCDDILPVLQSLDVFALTSYHEGLPISLLEAMALGTIPVCTRVGGMAEVIHDQINGLLVDINGVGQMAELLQKLNNDSKLRQSLSRNAIASMRHDYSMDRMASEVIKLYKTVVEGS